LAQDGPDSAYVLDEPKIQLMKKWLDVHRVLLLRSPPGSGKTSFAIGFANYLHGHGFTVYYMNASQKKNRMDKTNTMDDVWRAQFKQTFSEICQNASKRHPTYLIVDEAQAWYPANVPKDSRYEVDSFWSDIKIVFQAKLDWSNYYAELARGASQSRAASESGTNVRLLCLAGYGEMSLGSIATPLEFVDPMDPDTQTQLPLGLNFLRLDREKTHQLIKKYAEIMESEGKKTSFSLHSDILDLIFNETNGHVGVLRTLLFHLVTTDKKSREDILQFVSCRIYQSNLSGFHTFLSVNAATMKSLSPNDMALLVQCFVSYKQGIREFQATALGAIRLIKLGLLIKTSTETITGQITLAFPSPLHFDLALHNFLRRRMRLRQNPHCFEQAIKEMMMRMSPRFLRDTVPDEDQWQEECCKSLRSMTDKIVTTQVGRQFNQRAYLDMYVSDLKWGIELIRLGGGKRLDEHVRRFSEVDGRYRDIPMLQYAVLNFTANVPDQATLAKYDDVWHLVYNNTYTQVTVYRKNRVIEVWNLIGCQGRTEY
jgi:hypothetical protein